MIQLKHPCKTCLVRSCCKLNCVLYEKFNKSYEGILYFSAGVLSIIFHMSLITLLFKVGEYPISGLLFYLGGFCGIMFFTVVQNDSDYKDMKRFEKIVLWTLNPIWITSVIVIVICDHFKLDEYPQKHSPYYKRVRKETHEKSENKRSRSCYASTPR